jgi:long-subunit acyl-CoA synthetase (AMP-forming)
LTISNQKKSEAIVKKVFAQVASANLDCDDWVEIKKLVMKQVAPTHRKVFSRRDSKTKNHPPLNEFEKEMKEMYKEISGVTLLLRELDERREIYGRLFR